MFELVSLSQAIRRSLLDKHVHYTDTHIFHNAWYRLCAPLRFMMQLRAAPNQRIPPRLRGSLEFVVDAITHALPEDDVFIFSKRQFQKAFGDRGDPPRCEHYKRQDKHYLHI